MSSGTEDALRAALADRYQLERELGQGGMATVYLAEDLRHHRKVALKVMRPELSATLGPDRFLREIQTAAQLQHPHILPLLDSGTATGTQIGNARVEFLYFVMPYVEGESLRARIAREGELPVGEAVRLLRDVVDALAYAHSRGVVHRDIKPDNILISARHATITDFGVAKAVSEATGRNALTTAGMALGTPTYMAPEQAAADPHLDHRADLYAVGVVAYELLTGTPPFTGTSPQQILGAHVTQPPKPITEHRGTIPAPLAGIVMKCLEKKPADRWQSAEELMAQLDAWLTPSGGTTPIETKPFKAVKPLRLNLRLLALAAIVLLLLAAGFAGWRTLGAGGHRGHLRLAVLPARYVGPPERAYVADGMADEINNRLVKLSALEVIGRTSAERYRDTKLTPREIGSQLQADYLLALRIGDEGPADRRQLRVNAELVRAGSEAVVWANSYQAGLAEDYFKLQQSIAEQVAGEMGVTLGQGERQRIQRQPTADRQAYELYLRARNLLDRFNATSATQEALGYLEQAVDRDPRFAEAWAALGRAHTEVFWYHADRSSRRLELARQAIDKARALAPESETTEFALGVYYYHGYLDYGQALAHLRAALRADSGQADYYAWIAYVLRRKGDFEEARQGFSRARELDPRNLPVLFALAETLSLMGRPREAIPIAEDIASMEATAAATLAYSYMADGNLPKAISVAREYYNEAGLSRMLRDYPRELQSSLTILPRIDLERIAALYPSLTPAISDTAEYFYDRAELFRLVGRDSRADYDSAVVRYELRVRDRPDDGVAYVDLSQGYRGQGRRDEAVRAGRKAIELLAERDRYAGPDTHKWMALTWFTFGERDSAAAEFLRYMSGSPGNRLEARYHPYWAGLRELPAVRKELGL